MAARLIAAGHAVRVRSRRDEPALALAALGAQVASSVSACVTDADVVITVLPTEAAVTEVLEGDAGVVRACRRGAVLMEMSTISPETARNLAEVAASHHLTMLDMPVLGRPARASDGKLVVMVGGDRRAEPTTRVITDHLASEVFWMGDSGAGQTAKACHQLLLAVHYQAAVEALRLADHGRIDMASLHRALASSLANSEIWERCREQVMAGEASPGFAVPLPLKDLQIVLETAAVAGVSLPALRVVSETMSNEG